MYLDKPLAGHNLMQAIARVNRVYGEKPGGLIVDMIGLADPLADALKRTRARRGRRINRFRNCRTKRFPRCCPRSSNCERSSTTVTMKRHWITAPAKVLRVYLVAIDHVLDLKHNIGEETGGQRFREMVKQLARAFALAVPREETKAIAPHLAFFSA